MPAIIVGLLDEEGVFVRDAQVLGAAEALPRVVRTRWLRFSMLSP